MSQDLHKKKLEELVRNPFDMTLYSAVCSEIAGTSYNTINQEMPVSTISESYSDYIKSVIKVGDFNGTIDCAFFSIVLSGDKSVSNARTRQRDFAVKCLKKWDLDSGIFAYTDATKTWRLSFVKMDISLNEGKINYELTPVKRYSFMVGDGERTHTPLKQLLPLLTESEITNDDIETAFSVEAVSKEFFEEYKVLFERLNSDLTSFLRKPTNENIFVHFQEKNIVQKNDDDAIHYYDFCKRLLGQISFLYFVQKKGWLGVPKDKNWGDGDKNFLRTIFDNKDKNGKKNYFNDVLEPLFYEALADKRSDDGYYNALDCKIPFLNGGLFEPFLGYDWVKTDINLSDEIFCNGSTGILDIFDRYNFTVAEDEPLEKEVAVDPEMLGKVFENLLDENYRKGKGAFYTPREIVHYMCEQSLITHIETYNPDIKKQFIEDLVIKKSVDSVPQDIKDIADKIDTELSVMTICDPAIGSGAFPVGMLHEIVQVRTKLQIILGKAINTYEIKRNIIENCLYGVDLDPGAIDVAKLRLWLSLVVDEDDVSNIKPLPNLDYKIMQGNSLLNTFAGIKLDVALSSIPQHKEHLLADTEHLYPPVVEPTQYTNNRDMFSQVDDIQDGLIKAHSDFFNETDRDKKVGHKEKISNIEWKLMTTALSEQGRGDKIGALEKVKEKNIKPYFLWNLNFPKVFNAGGFDVVIGNPPYIQIQKFEDKALKEQWKKDYKVFAGTGDIYCLFYELAVNSVKNGGHVSYITSNKFMRAGYGKSLRGYFATQTDLKTVLDLGSGVFETATVDSSIMSTVKTAPNNDNAVQTYTISHKLETLNLYETLKDNATAMPKTDFTESSWSLLSNDVYHIMKIMNFDSVPLGKYVDDNIYRGVLTGLNEAFVIDNDKRNELIAEDPKSAELIKPLLRGRDIKAWHPDYKGLYLITIASSQNKKWKWSDSTTENDSEKVFFKEYPAIAKHLIAHKERLQKRSDKGDFYWELRACVYYDEFSKPKIMYPDMVQNTSFIWDEKGDATNDTAFIITGNNKAIVSFLNSKISMLWIENNCTGLGNTGHRLKKIFMEKLPIPNALENMKEPFENLADYMTLLTKLELGTNADYFKELIDIAVFGIYFQAKMENNDCYITDGLWEFIPELTGTDAEKKIQLEALHKDLQKEPYIAKAFLNYKTIPEIQTILKETE